MTDPETGTSWSRREMLKKSVVAGGVALWAIPAVEVVGTKIAAAASAQVAFCESGGVNATVTSSSSSEVITLTPANNCYFTESPNVGATSTILVTATATNGAAAAVTTAPTANCGTGSSTVVTVTYPSSVTSTTVDVTITVTFNATTTTGQLTCSTTISVDPSLGESGSVTTTVVPSS